MNPKTDHISRYSEETRVVLIDIGNTRIKYTLLCDAHKEPLTCDHVSTLLAYIDASEQKITHIYAASVRNSNIIAEISNACAHRNIIFVEKHTEAEAFGIRNGYANVQKMGVDRWLAMICAAEKTKKAFFVLDIGTAITVDFVVDGQHLGGWITPGYSVMKDALINSTDKVTANAQIPTSFGIGQDTEDCVATGCFAAAYGVYLTALDYLSSKQTDFDVIIGGGGKKMFAFLESGDSILAANLVVQGLARYARRDLCVTFD